MVRGYVGISILLWFSFTSCYLALARSISLGENTQMSDKNSSFFIPVRRFTKTQDEGSNIISHYAMWHTVPGEYYGLRAEISIWGSPNQKDSQESGASLQIYCKDGGNYNLIEVGFHVSPSLYHNRDVRFFTYWTKDSRSAGCYNLQCPGFVPTRGAALVPGQAVTPPSSYGEQDRYVRLSLNKDPNSGDWVVYRHDLETPSFLGYFPIELCPKMPVKLALTGFVNYLNNTEGPPMGSGHFPDMESSNKKIAYFKHIKKYNSGGHAYDPILVKMLYYVDRPDCYIESDFVPAWNEGYIFHYGGPSGCIG
uniref:Uncharacterized protein n=1 Tax=Avena sativa TaxID=4498 RepID=A0ACD5XX81_AVESA